MSPPQNNTSNNSGYRRWSKFKYTKNLNPVRQHKPISVPISDANSLDNSKASSSSEQPPCTSTAISANQRIVSFQLDENTGRYSGWKLYFPEEPFKEESIIVGKTKVFEDYLARMASKCDFEKAKNYSWFPLDLFKVLEDEQLTSKWLSFKQDLLDSPEETLKCVGLAMYQCLTRDPSYTKTFYFQKIYARIQTNMKTLSYNLLKINNCGKLITIRGNVIRVGPRENRATWIAYRCTLCKSEQTIKQTNLTNATTPKSCRCKNRSANNFIAVVTSHFTQTEAYQTISIQETMSGVQSGRVPRTIEIELGQDLVEVAYPGDDVTVTGILLTQPQEERYKAAQGAMFKMYLKAVSVSSKRNVSITWKSSFTEKDMEAIRTIKSEPCPFRLLVHSLSPMIYGHEMVKAGLILGLLGGSDNPHRRSQSHVLIVGDPGLGKSQMLQACADASPKGVFVCGKTSSRAGLTVTIHHEKGNDTTLGAGSLILADQGTCCIDEFDKIPNSHQALLEVMEQQCVSIAKAGVYCCLPARTSVFAAANPSGDHYDKSRTVSENLKMNPALLSRFDLVFILLDRPDPQLDAVLHDHRNVYRNIPQVLASSSSFTGNQSILENNLSDPLHVRLKLRQNETIDTLPHKLIQTYIAYARNNCHATLSVEAANLLRDFYLELRKVKQGGDSIPVTNRQLEAFVRLTQARARADLCSEATVQHAQDVIEIAKYTMVDVMSTDVGVLQMQRNVNGSGMSQASQIRQFVRTLQIRSRTLNKSTFSIDELKEIANTGGLRFPSFLDAIETMNIQGYLLKKGSSLYKFLND